MTKGKGKAKADDAPAEKCQNCGNELVDDTCSNCGFNLAEHEKLVKEHHKQK